jgi:hypothetical protein
VARAGSRGAGRCGMTHRIARLAHLGTGVLMAQCQNAFRLVC